MLWRPAARLVTGPLAFLIAGAIDVGAIAVAVLRQSIRRRVAENRGKPHRRAPARP